MKESKFYKKSGLLRKLDEQVIKALDLNDGEEIFINLFYDATKSSHSRILQDVASYFLVTTERIIIYNARPHVKRSMFSAPASARWEVNVIAVLPINEIVRISVKMKHTPQKKERLLYIASTKKPSISIETGGDKTEIFFKTVFRFKKKIPLIIDCIKTINSNIETSIDFYVDNMHSANMEILFDGIPADTPEGIKQRKRLFAYLLVVLVLLGVAYWVVGGQLLDLYHGKQLYW